VPGVWSIELMSVESSSRTSIAPASIVGICRKLPSSLLKTLRLLYFKLKGSSMNAAYVVLASGRNWRSSSKMRSLHAGRYVENKTECSQKGLVFTSAPAFRNNSSTLRNALDRGVGLINMNVLCDVAESYLWYRPVWRMVHSLTFALYSGYLIV